MKFFTLFLFVSLSALTFAQSNLYKQYSNNGYDFGQGIVELPDSSYVITGASSSFLDGPSEMFLLKVDSLGEYIWSKHYGGLETDWGRRVKHIPTIGYYVGGYTNSSGNGAYDFALWKVDESGNEEWFKTYGTEGWERVHDMVITIDSGVILVGETNNTIDGYTDIYIVRTDIDGNVLWENQIDNPGDDNALVVKQFDDSTYIVGGYYYNTATNFKQAWLKRIQDDGTELWTQTWGDASNFDVADIEIYNSTIYGIGGSTPNDATHNMAVYKIDGTDGTVLVLDVVPNNFYHGEGIASFFNNGAFIVCASYFDEAASYGYEDLWYYGYTGDPYYYGNLGSIKYHTSQHLGELNTTYNFGAVSVGYNENIGPGGSSIFLMRIGNGQPFFDVYDQFDTGTLVSVVAPSQDEENFAVYPNPVDDKLFFTSDNDNVSETTISIFDVSGRLVKTVNTMGLTTHSMDVSDLNEGIYTVVVNDEKNQLVKKIQIK